MPKINDILGKRFGRLLVIDTSPKRQNGKACWVCRCDCGNEKTISGSTLRQGYSNSCGCLKQESDKTRLKPFTYLKGSEHPGWKGGRRQTKSGYIQVLSSKHPRSDPYTGYVFEHILAYEQANEIHVPRGWTIHHKNGIRNDNRPENLELWRKSHPAGQKLEEIVNDIVLVVGRDKLLSQIAKHELTKV